MNQDLTLAPLSDAPDRTAFEDLFNLADIQHLQDLFAQACGRPANDNYIDGAWEMWGVACDRVIPTHPGCAELHIPGVPAPTVGAAGK